MPTLEQIRSALPAHRPVALDGDNRASVAIVLRGDLDGSPEVLFIERARRRGDPWSGHMAFPGGRVSPEDSGARDAAERETREEVGLSLSHAERLGRLDDMQGRPATAAGALVISAYVYHCPDPPPLVPNHEVRTAFWFPLGELLEGERHIDHPVASGARARFPGILVGEPGRHVVWGLTYRFLECFLEIVGRPLPERWDPSGSPDSSPGHSRTGSGG